MREADRPIEVRVSVLDRPRTERDALPERMQPMHERREYDESSVRLALVDRDRRIYIARAVRDDGLFHILGHSSGGSASGGPRSTFVTHGARYGWSSGSDGHCVAFGVVPDPVVAVTIDGVPAKVENNAFLADVPTMGGEIVLTTAEGERVVPRPPTLRPLRSIEESTVGPDGEGYLGMVEYAQSGICDLVIDDLDSESWHGVPRTFLVTNTPNVWTVGVVLLEGPRAGELAMGDLVVVRGSDGPADSVQFNGRTAFGPHPDPPRLEAALARLRQLGGRY